MGTPQFVAHLAGGALAEGSVFGGLDEVVLGADMPLAPGAAFHPTHGMVNAGEADTHGEFSYRAVGRLPQLGNPWDRAIVAPIEAVWWVHSLPLGHVVDEAKLYPSGPDAAPDWSAVPLGPPWVEGELTDMPAIVVEPTSFAAANQLRQQYRTRDGAPRPSSRPKCWSSSTSSWATCATSWPGSRS